MGLQHIRQQFHPDAPLYVHAQVTHSDAEQALQYGHVGNIFHLLMQYLHFLPLT